MNEWIVITGNIVDGVYIYGPFNDAGDAHEWADNEINSEWFVAPLQHPK